MRFRQRRLRRSDAWNRLFSDVRPRAGATRRRADPGAGRRGRPHRGADLCTRCRHALGLVYRIGRTRFHCRRRRARRHVPRRNEHVAGGGCGAAVFAGRRADDHARPPHHGAGRARALRRRRDRAARVAAHERELSHGAGHEHLRHLAQRRARSRPRRCSGHAQRLDSRVHRRRCLSPGSRSRPAAPHHRRAAARHPRGLRGPRVGLARSDRARRRHLPLQRRAPSQSTHRPLVQRRRTARIAPALRKDPRSPEPKNRKPAALDIGHIKRC